MTVDGKVPAAFRDGTLAVVALLLLAAPLWVPAVDLGEPRYQYERAQVVVDETDGVTFANETKPPFGTHVSDDIGCSVPADTRTCAFERHLASNNTVPTAAYVTGPDATPRMPAERYRFVQVEGSLYETTYVANESARRGGQYRVDLALEPVEPAAALREVARDASSDSADVPAVAVTAAKQGEATARREVAVPRTPLRLADGTYYRVYLADSRAPHPATRYLGGLLPIYGPLFGLAGAYRLSGRFEVRRAGDP